MLRLSRSSSIVSMSVSRSFSRVMLLRISATPCKAFSLYYTQELYTRPWHPRKTGLYRYLSRSATKLFHYTIFFGFLSFHRIVSRQRINNVLVLSFYGLRKKTPIRHRMMPMICRGSKTSLYSRRPIPAKRSATLTLARREAMLIFQPARYNRM